MTKQLSNRASAETYVERSQTSATRHNFRLILSSLFTLLPLAQAHAIGLSHASSLFSSPNVVYVSSFVVCQLSNMCAISHRLQIDPHSFCSSSFFFFSLSVLMCTSVAIVLPLASSRSNLFFHHQHQQQLSDPTDSTKTTTTTTTTILS